MLKQKKKLDSCNICVNEFPKQELTPCDLTLTNNPGRRLFIKVCKKCLESIRSSIRLN